MLGPETPDPNTFRLIPRFLSNREADEALVRLWQELEWSQQEIVLFGRHVMQPRLVAWYGEPEAAYCYSGLTLTPLAWHPLLLRLRDRIEVVTGKRFNAVLANAYRDGRDSMGWHSDDEPELGDAPVIASLSLGATRRFLLRRRVSGTRKRPASIALSLGHGSLLLMQGNSQSDYQHALPRTQRAVTLRINLTYRLIRE